MSSKSVENSKYHRSSISIRELTMGLPLPDLMHILQIFVLLGESHQHVDWCACWYARISLPSAISPAQQPQEKSLGDRLGLRTCHSNVHVPWMRIAQTSPRRICLGALCNACGVCDIPLARIIPYAISESCSTASAIEIRISECSRYQPDYPMSKKINHCVVVHC